MMHLEETITVPARIEKAFDFVADFSTTQQWDPGVERARLISGNAPGIGNRYEVISNFGGRELVLEYVTEAFERPYRLVFRGGDRRFESVDTIDFEPAGSGTKIVYQADFRMKGLFALVEPFLKNRFRDVARKGASGLADALGGQV